MPQYKSDIRKIGKLNLTEKEIIQIHGRKIATPGATYTDKDGNTYIGTKNRRLRSTGTALSGDVSSTGSATGSTEVTVERIGDLTVEDLAEINQDVEELLQCISTYFEVDLDGDLVARCNIDKIFDDHLYDIDENGDLMPAVEDGTRSAHFGVDEFNNIECKPIN